MPIRGRLPRQASTFLTDTSDLYESIGEAPIPPRPEMAENVMPTIRGAGGYDYSLDEAGNIYVENDPTGRIPAGARIPRGSPSYAAVAEEIMRGGTPVPGARIADFEAATVYGAPMQAPQPAMGPASSPEDDARRYNAGRAAWWDAQSADMLGMLIGAGAAEQVAERASVAMPGPQSEFNSRQGIDEWDATRQMRENMYDANAVRHDPDLARLDDQIGRLREEQRNLGPGDTYKHRKLEWDLSDAERARATLRKNIRSNAGWDARSWLDRDRAAASARAAARASAMAAERAAGASRAITAPLTAAAIGTKAYLDTTQFGNDPADVMTWMAYQGLQRPIGASELTDVQQRWLAANPGEAQRLFEGGVISGDAYSSTRTR